jgi:ABC-type arginine/histidine transport system permease subunit
MFLRRKKRRQWILNRADFMLMFTIRYLMIQIYLSIYIGVETIKLTKKKLILNQILTSFNNPLFFEFSDSSLNSLSKKFREHQIKPPHFFAKH